MSFDFPATPLVGDKYPSPGVPGLPQYTWNGSTWDSGSSFAPQVKKNFVINGAMMVSQEYGGTAATATSSYPVDQFIVMFPSVTGTVTMSQVASTTPANSPYRLRITITGTDTSVAATDYVQVITHLEGYRVAELRLGTSSARTFTLRFGVRAPAGTYCVAFANYNASRNYVVEYTISAAEANTDVVRTMTVPGDVVGTWYADNSIGLGIHFTLMVGSTYQTAAPLSWVGVNVLGTANQYNLMGVLNNTFELFDVGLYEGTVAPAYVIPDYGEELRACMRYYEKLLITMASAPITSGNCHMTWFFKTMKRAIPTVTFASGSSTTGIWYNNLDGVNAYLTNGNPVFATGSTANARY